MNVFAPPPPCTVRPRTLRPGPRLHARAHGLGPALLALCAVALLCLLLADRLRPGLGPGDAPPLLALGPLLVAGTIGVSLHEHGAELGATGARSARLLRPVRLLALLVAGTLLLLLAATAAPAEGRDAAALLRNVLGATGLAAGTAALAGARVSWLPPAAYLAAVQLSGAGFPTGRAAQVWGWSACPGDQVLPWAPAVLLFLGGTALHALRGPRAESR